MDILNTIFRIGVILGIFGFVWSLIQIALVLLFPTFATNRWGNYFLKAIQSLFVIQTTLLFCFDDESNLSLGDSSLAVTSLILLFYVVSKFQKRQQKQVMFQFIQNGNSIQNSFYYPAELALIFISLIFYFICLAYNPILFNPITLWFQETIIGLEKAPIIGFLFQIVGFFFVLGVILKSARAIQQLFQGRQSQGTPTNRRDDDKFDDFEEIK